MSASRISNQEIDHAPPHPNVLNVIDERDHLLHRGGVVRCEECRSCITVDPTRPDIEYGHRKQEYRRDNPGRCSHRPAELDDSE